MPMMLRAIMVTQMPMPAFAPVLSPFAAGVVAAFTTDVMVGVCVVIESEVMASFVAAISCDGMVVVTSDLAIIDRCELEKTAILSE